tara:strand:- start:61 stop:582 length:522 start_codon:yes stop_codon:yes gene_type:complete
MKDSDFDFDDCVGIANRPAKDLNGFVRGKLTNIDLRNIEIKKPRSKNDPEDDVIQTVLKFTFSIEGKREDITMSKITGTKISTDVVHTKGKGRGSKEEHEYNALTEICLKLGIFKKDEITDEKQDLLLKKLKDAVQSITDEKPIYIKTKLETSEKSTEFENINVRTIELIENF